MRIPRPRGEPRPRWARGWRGMVVAACLLGLAMAHLAVIAPTPLSGGPRPTLSGPPLADRWVPPRPVTDERFATFPATGPRGEPGLWVMPSSRVPIRFRAEREVVDRYGQEALDEAIEVFNDVPGSQFGAEVSRVVDDGVEARERDGVNRIFFDRASCGERYLARAHLWSRPIHVRHGIAVRYVDEVDIGLCDRLGEDALSHVIRHELGHIAGLDHLCDPGEDCHRRGMGEDNECRIMSPRLRGCQQVEQGDLDGLVHLHPRLPRAGGGDDRTSAANAARVAYPTSRRKLRAVVTRHDAPPVQRLLATSLAGHLDVPNVLVDEDCTSGPDGAALDHVLAVNATVTAVGQIPGSCATTLEGAWELELETLVDARAVVEEMIEHAPRPPARLVVTTRPRDAREIPLMAAAAPAAAVIGAPMMVLGPDGEVGPILDVLEDHPSIREVVIVGDIRLVGARAAAALRTTGAAVRRLSVSDALEATAEFLQQPELAGRGPYPAAVIAEAHPEHATAGAALAASFGGLLLPVSSPPSPLETQLLTEQFDRGAIVGGVQAISPELQIHLSRALDGAGE